MTKIPGPPSFDGLKRRIERHRAEGNARKGDHFVRQTYRLGLLDARAKAREWFAEYPKAAYWTEVESWRQLDNDQIEFTMRRLPSAD
ncbi:hypothetical protein C9413_05800 [Rhizobium sp. SEMIA 4085]|uniref:Uncharacterized protein n=1 Tax=Rhizobium gallicum bv. gallicum R602sp TaxID=1041138 RepID=A0A0B4X4D2_9HYPH|nr:MULTISPECIES: hypothetical protein [Rhizobium]AJD41996.1 hypothetical protein RGR602_CH02676 [Rhizobium gallicum bv. gallicum R602sp]NNH29034.1 hypothetical protein [Rhizobium sp. SEMIA 4085]TDW26843.1 hypothetical protein EV128_113174 [Rhizobium azibense]